MEEEDNDNPFRPGGNLDTEATLILRSSTIQRDNLSIYDPDKAGYKDEVDNSEAQVSAVDVVISPIQVSESHATRVHFSPRHSNEPTPTNKSKNSTPEKNKNRTTIIAPNGDTPVKNGVHESEVGLVTAGQAQPLQAETVCVGGKDKQRKCCDLM